MSFSIFYQRRRDESGRSIPSRERRDIILAADLPIGANDADRLAKQILDDFRDVVAAAWAEQT